MITGLVALLDEPHLMLLGQRQPISRVLIKKIDWDSAYHCLHLMTETTVQAIVMCGGLLLVVLHLTFGGTVSGAANPSQWSDRSEMICDLANDLVRHPDWSPDLCPSPLKDQ